ncbi:MAG: VOC family protein [Candidatus Peregrinibacteria bacterium]|nr:VOC family protein [Candidatus Peregrinibacteria bacterium]
MKIHHVAITVNNIEESKKFYEDFFGFTEHQRFKSKSSLGDETILIELKDFKIELWKSKKDNEEDLLDLTIRGIRHLAFEVEDIDNVVSKFREENIQVSEPQMGGSGHRYCFTTDPNGIALELYER